MAVHGFEFSRRGRQATLVRRRDVVNHVAIMVPAGRALTSRIEAAMTELAAAMLEYGARTNTLGGDVVEFMDNVIDVQPRVDP